MKSMLNLCVKQLKCGQGICHGYLYHNMPLISFTVARFSGPNRFAHYQETPSSPVGH